MTFTKELLMITQAIRSDSLAEEGIKKVEVEKASAPRDEEKKQSLNELVKESHNTKAEGIMQQILGLRKQRSKLIGISRRGRRMLAYKEEEKAALDKMVNEAEMREANSKVIYLKKMKKRLEFKISTEAASLNAEKELVKRISDVNAQLDKALAPLRLERRLSLVKGDAERYGKEITNSAKEIAEIDTKLDGLYTELRRTLGIAGGRRQQHAPRKEGRGPSASQEISLEDIAVIKKVEKK